jgi:hypothetical protein
VGRRLRDHRTSLDIQQAPRPGFRAALIYYIITTTLKKRTAAKARDSGRCGVPL